MASSVLAQGIIQSDIDELRVVLGRHRMLRGSRDAAVMGVSRSFYVSAGPSLCELLTRLSLPGRCEGKGT
jgi:hypothetical protein